MKRLTKEICGRPHGAEGKSEEKLTGAYCRGEFEATAIVERLFAIEEILGDDYDLERLRVIVNQRMSMREEVQERFSITKNIPVDRLRELMKADEEKRNITLPEKFYIGQEIFVIESFLRTGLLVDVYRNFVKGFAENGIFYQHSPTTPVYFENFENIGKTIFSREKEAKAALEEMRK